MIVESLLILAAISPLGIAPRSLQGPDTLAAIRKVNDAFSERYWNSIVNKPGGWGPPGRGRISQEEIGDWLGWRCSPDEGAQFCFGGDWVREVCPGDVFCHPPTGDLEELLLESARQHPESGYLTGQAVFNLTRFGRPLDAMQIAESCEAEEGWCRALEGHVLHSVGRVQESETRFRQFIETTPDSVRCRYADATWLVGQWSFVEVRQNPRPPEIWTSWQDHPCGQRLTVSDTLWWLADPLYIVDGNDRWAEHVDRMLRTTWATQIIRSKPSQEWPRAWQDARRAGWIRRGPFDSFQWETSNPSLFVALWTSRKAARYHFMPDFRGEGFQEPVWRLVGEMDEEGYTPPYGTFHPLPVQIARFRHTGSAAAVGTSSESQPRSTSMHLALAATVRGSPIADAAEAAYLVLTDAPDSFPLQLQAPFTEERAVFLAQATPKRYVTSLEVLTEAGIGRHRETVEPLAAEGPGLSDILLYEPVGLAEPDSLMAAASSMLGTTEVEDVRELGLYWEVYGPAAETPLAFTLRLEEEGGGFVERLRRLLPGGAEEATGTLSWTEPAAGPVSPKAIVLGVQELDPGRYTLVLQVGWEGQEEVLERRRELVIR